MKSKRLLLSLIVSAAFILPVFSQEDEALQTDDLRYIISLLESLAAGDPSEKTSLITDALEYLKSGDPGKAEKALESYLEGAPPAHPANLTLAAILYYNGNLNKAESILKTIVDENDQQAGPFYYLGSIYMLRADFKTAETHLTRSLELDPKNRRTLLRLGTLYSMRGDSSTKAISNLRRAYPNYDEDADLNYELGVLYYRKKLYTEASFFFDRAIKLGKNDIEHRLALARSLYYQGKLDDAYKLLRRLTREDRKNPAIQYFYGAVLLGQEKYGRAVKAFERTHRLSDGYADSLYYVAFCHFKQGLYRQAMSRLIQYRLDKMMKGKKKAEKLSDSMQLILEIEKLLEIQRLPNQVPGNYSGMVQVPGGQMYYGWDGTDDSKTAAIQMRVAPFAIDTMEVSNAEYEVFVKACDWRSPQGKGTALEEASLAWTESVPEEIASLPVVFVSWEDATAYAAWCGKRLPSELEWEFAARGGLVGTAYPWKSRPNGKQAQFGDTERPRAVTEGEVNGYGMLNIVGNAAEWCLDVFDDDLRTSLELRSKEASKNAPRAYRGGHWRSGPEDITVTVRRGLPPGTRNEFIGFRCATDITESK